MSTVIDRHYRELTFSGIFHRIYLNADVSLIEHEDASFEFCVDYSYTGTVGGSGRACLPVSGDASEERDEGEGLYVDYTIRNWQATERAVSCDVTVLIRYRRGSGYLFENQRFAGLRRL